jgi:hypothetical protein
VRPEITTDDASVTEPPSGTTTIPITVRLSSEMDNAVSVDYATADGTAHAGEDYVATSGTLTFAPHERAKTVDVTVLADQAAEGDETFTLNLSNESSGTMVDNQAVVTILAPQPPPPPPPFTPPKCVVPNVLHLKLTKAKARIRSRHCRVGNEQEALFAREPGPRDQADPEGEQQEAAEWLQGEAHRRQVGPRVFQARLDRRNGAFGLLQRLRRP